MSDKPPRTSSWPRHREAGGFTLIELLVVMAIITALISIMLPAMRTVKITTNRVLCAAQVKQITMGILIIADENDGKFPAHDSNPTDVSNHNFNLKPTLRAVVPVVETFYCPSTGHKNSTSLIDMWDDSAWDHQQHGTDYPIYFNAVNVAFTLRTSIHEVEQPAEEVMMGDFVYTAPWYPWNPGLEHLFTAGEPFWANHRVGYECVTRTSICGPGVPPAGANWSAYDGHVEWRHVKELRYLGWGGSGPWNWYN